MPLETEHTVILVTHFTIKLKPVSFWKDCLQYVKLEKTGHRIVCEIFKLNKSGGMVCKTPETGGKRELL
jgi:hypothetical protein